ncbi:hypothetical protein [Natrinema sp. SYSU A 869]|uniref:hypothetical protein n=1 Tax=Natrinema sp. SYSU A 869 TaxID=2871694 RepID=UPI001CA3E80C|nr:hypothetical protein [Natrinema sp. SYSU A 869]
MGLIVAQGRHDHVGDGVRGHRSTGFGAAATEWATFCSRRCRARWRGDDVVLGATEQATLALFRDGVRSSDPSAIAWSCS